MLDLAINHVDKLTAEYRKMFSQLDKYKYYMASVWCEYQIKIDESNWNRMQLVSLDKEGNVIGYFSANINREIIAADNMQAINFGDKGNFIFATDLVAFIEKLFVEFNMQKINWRVCMGNPIEKMYDKFCLKVGGRIVGIYEQDYKLVDGEIHDGKAYELLRKNFIEYKEKKHIR